MRAAGLVLIVYGLCAGVDSYASEHGKRRFLKTVLMPLLALYYVLAMHPALADPGAVGAAEGRGLYHVTLVIALLCGWAGDCFLLGKKAWCFPAGLLAFLAGHLVYIGTFITDTVRRQGEGMNARAAILIILIGIAAYSGLIQTVKRKLTSSVPGQLRGAFFAYVTAISLMSLSALCRMVFLGSWAVMTFIGSLLFLVSDLLLALETFSGGSKRGIMETYTLAQALIVLGMIL